MTFIILRQLGFWAEQQAQDVNNNEDYRKAARRLHEAIKEILPYC